MALFSDRVSTFDILGNSENFSQIIIRQSEHDGDQAFSMDRDMLRVFTSVDGKRNLLEIATHLDLPVDSIREVVNRLLHADLVEIVDENKDEKSENFFKILERELALAIGPIAFVVIEDEIEAMSENLNTFPMQRAAELVNLLARQISREEKRVLFQQAMIQYLKNI